MSYLSGCHHFICVDGCHLSRPYEMALLGVISVDVNDGVYPLIVVVIGKENLVNLS